MSKWLFDLYLFVKATGFPIKDARFSKSKIISDFLSNDMEGKIVEISALHILAIGRLLWEILYIYELLIKQWFWNTLYFHVILDDSRFSLVVHCHQSILCSWKYFLMRSLSIFYPSSHLSLSKFDFLYILRSIKPSALFASLGFLSFDKPIFQWFQYYKHYIYRIESKQIFASHHIKHYKDE